MIRRLIILLLIVGCVTESEDCAGVEGGTAVEDDCGVCGGDALSCDQPALFVYNSSIVQAFYFFTIVKIDDKNISPSDWVGAFNNDVCVGVRQWDTSLCGSGICELPVMGSDGNSGTDGYMQSGGIPLLKYLMLQKILIMMLWLRKIIHGQIMDLTP